MGYRAIAQAVTASFIEKKSEFIATLVPVQTADAAIACIEEVRKANRKARHNVYAYILRENHMTRYSDDGEPQGTAGVPVLNVLQKQNLTDVCWSPVILAAFCWAAAVWYGRIPTVLHWQWKQHRFRQKFPVIQ